ncbi:RCC1 repeat domain protein, partial [Bifidobacterium coryneforme]
MPASQTIPDGKTATWPHDDPTRPGWTFNGWFQGDTAYDFTKPVTTDLTLTAKWGKWNTSPDKGPWHGGTNVKIDTPGSQVRFSHISSGAQFSLALGSDGNAYGWGDNAFGQLGLSRNQSVYYHRAPRMTAMPEGVKFTQVSAGWAHGIALDRDGRIWTWGFDFGGCLGRPVDGLYGYSPGLASVPEGVTFTAVSAGKFSSMALDSNGQAWTWGWIDTDTPHKVAQGEGIVFTAICAVNNTNGYTALDTDGRIWNWRHPYSKLTPVETDVRFKAYSIDPGCDHFIAIARDGTVWTWDIENNGNGQLGRIPDSANPADKPGRVPGLTGATQVDAGSRPIGVDTGVSLAITDTGAWAWGSNNHGQLGTGTGKITDTPARVVTPAGAPTGFRYIGIAASDSHTVLLGSDGETYTYGRNQYGKLGDGTDTDSDPANPQPARTWRPVERDLTKVLFGEARNIGGPYRRSDGWHATSPRHSLGTVTLTIQSAVTNGTPQPDETSQRFTYTGDTATVTFKSEHGSPAPPQQVIVGDTVRRPDDPTTDDGWTFNGWFQGDRPYDFTQPVSGDTVLTARWGRWKADPAQGPWRGGTDV